MASGVRRYSTYRAAVVWAPLEPVQGSAFLGVQMVFQVSTRMDCLQRQRISSERPRGDLHGVLWLHERHRKLVEHGPEMISAGAEDMVSNERRLIQGLEME